MGSSSNFCSNPANCSNPNARHISVRPELRSPRKCSGGQRTTPPEKPGENMSKTTQYLCHWRRAKYGVVVGGAFAAAVANQKRCPRSSPWHSSASKKSWLQTMGREPAQVHLSTLGSSSHSEECAAPVMLTLVPTVSKSSCCCYLGQQLIFKPPGPILTHLS